MTLQDFFSGSAAAALTATCRRCINSDILAASAAYLHFARIWGPYFLKRNGQGRQAIVKNAGIELAHWFPRCLYVTFARSGRPVAKRDRSSEFVAIADAA